MSGTCRTCVYLSVYKKEGDIFWTNECLMRNGLILSEDEMNTPRGCYKQRDNNQTLYADGQRKPKSIWTNEGEKDSIFEHHSTDEMLNFVKAIRDRYNILIDPCTGETVRINDKFEIVERIPVDDPRCLPNDKRKRKGR